MNQISEVTRGNIIYEASPRVKVKNQLSSTTLRTRCCAGNTPGAPATCQLPLSWQEDGGSLEDGAFLHGISNASKQSHVRQQTSQREPQLSSISFVWVFLCANGAGCGWLRLADGLFVTRIGAPRPPPMLATALKPFSLLVDGHGGDCVHLPSLREVNYELSQP